MRIRYNLPLLRLPEKCVCSTNFDIEHALNCKKGGFISNRHNTIRDFTAHVLKEVTNDVEVEPLLEPHTGEKLNKSSISTDNARVDIAARNVWIKGQRVYFDVRVFNPLSRTYRDLSLSKVYERSEKEKKRSYNERILQIQHGSFTPLIFSTLGGMGRECSTFYSKLAEMVAEKKGTNKSETTTWLRTGLSFAILRATNICIRGSRGLKRVITEDIDYTVVNKESCVESINV